jgi:hypothetical protein
VPSESMGRMPLIAVADIPFICVLPLQWPGLVRNLSAFQKNLQSGNEVGLSALYPRIVIWTYAFCLFSWGEYCGQLQAILQSPRKSLVAEAFLRHICQIDSYVDAFDSRNVWLNEPGYIKHLPEVRLTSQGLCHLLKAPGITVRIRKSVVQLINAFRRNALRAMQDWAGAPDTLDHTLRVKRQTAGMLWHCWSSILGQVYEIAPSLASRVSATFFNYGMLVQIADDLADTPVDYRVKTHNLLIAIARETPAEWDALQRHLATHGHPYLGWPWVKSHLPISYKTIRAHYNQYAHRLLRDKCAPSVAERLYRAVEKVRRMST